MKKRYASVLSIMLASSVALTGCGTKEEEKPKADAGTTTNADKPAETKDAQKETAFTVGMVTDVGGVDDKSFNQSAWEGLQKFGADNSLQKGKEGFDYLQSKSDADYSTNLNKMVRDKYGLIYGIGYMMTDAIDKIAKQQPDSKFAIVDSVVNQPNVANITFKEHEGSFLVGVVAGLTTKTNKIGFVGGMKGPLIGKFEAGFVAGVTAVNPKAKVEIQYAGAFDKAELGKTIASSMYASGTDIIYHAAGGTGAGVFSEAKDLKEKDPSRELWVIGVDRDQAAEGLVKSGGNVTLTSMVKRVDVAVQDVSKKTKEGQFPAGKVIEYGLHEDGVGIAPTQENVKPEVLKAVDEWKAKIISGEVKVPSEPAKK